MLALVERYDGDDLLRPLARAVQYPALDAGVGTRILTTTATPRPLPSTEDARARARLREQGALLGASRGLMSRDAEGRLRALLEVLRMKRALAVLNDILPADKPGRTQTLEAIARVLRAEVDDRRERRIRRRLDDASARSTFRPWSSIFRSTTTDSRPPNVKRA